ncbi:D-alanyl-D-alanine carboxypeptidase (penicillin-binding protein 5/6) [Neobacillus niacini]|uniref:D-alanyl-D-alanine carboxypeptidase family protein n=1 Tax=Neobacillus driksii TaxID=3035913 RepID=UPI002781CF68|nr:D-alanyl-D-alanine carboxypeptidase family protein [Neobacillus niacini]MDQ0976378.1 D-alanyl-D-alanine carboxypeptidase (penicillin-binding protein 5/6) [Neobacillus niacini]
MSKLVSVFMILTLLLSNQVNAYAEENQTLEIKSESAVLVDSETGAILYSKNSNERLYPASLTKIATAIYAIENGNIDDVVTVSARAVKEEGTRVYLVEGERVPLKKLIQGMLINSGNDAAVAIAEHLDGSVELFAANINKFLVEKIGVSNTHFTNPNGLFNENHYTTALDLALITNYAMKNPVFKEIFGTIELEWVGESWETKLLTHHRLLKGEIPVDGITGGKTGFVNESKHTLATTAENENLKLTAIVLKADSSKASYNDTVKLIEYGFSSFKHRIIKQNELFTIHKKEYYPKNDIVVTEHVNTSKESISEQGMLEIVNTGQVSQSIQLEVKEPKPIKVTKEKLLSSEQSSINIFYGIIVFALAGLLIGVRKRWLKKQ